MILIANHHVISLSIPFTQNMYILKKCAINCVHPSPLWAGDMSAGEKLRVGQLRQNRGGGGNFVADADFDLGVEG
jgi:hypothetical protein